MTCHQQYDGTSSIGSPPQLEALHDAWLAEAAVEKAHAAALHAAGRAAARELIAEYEVEHGQLPDESRQRARQFMMEAGLLDDDHWQTAG